MNRRILAAVLVMVLVSISFNAPAQAAHVNNTAASGGLPLHGTVPQTYQPTTGQVDWQTFKMTVYQLSVSPGLPRPGDTVVVRVTIMLNQTYTPQQRTDWRLVALSGSTICPSCTAPLALQIVQPTPTLHANEVRSFEWAVPLPASAADGYYEAIFILDDQADDWVGYVPVVFAVSSANIN